MRYTNAVYFNLLYMQTVSSSIRDKPVFTKMAKCMMVQTMPYYSTRT